MDYTGIARRADFNLRAHYPDLITEIFQLAADRFSIVCVSSTLDFTSYQNYFNENVLPMGASQSIELTVERPEHFLTKVPVIQDWEAARNFEGLSLSLNGLQNLLLAKFQQVPFLKIERGIESLVIVTATYNEQKGDTTYHRYLNGTDRARIAAFLEGLKMGLVYEFREEAISGPEQIVLHSTFNPVQFIEAASHQRAQATPYGLRDESLWYDNLDLIFEGRFKKEDLYFYDSAEYACYVDYSSFGNIDIRNHLFLYQVVYLTLPYEKSIGEWLAMFKIHKHEFISLVAKGRVKLVLTQPEFRYDLNFINEVYEANPLAVITRRALGALLQIDVVTTADNYLLNDPTILPQLRQLCQIGKEITGLDANYLYNSLIWPIKARRSSFEPIESSGIFSAASFGVNNFLQSHIGGLLDKDLTFEFITSASAIHLANALNATYFPFKAEDGYSDSYYATVMGDSLNFYKNATANGFKDFVASRERIKAGISPISPIDVIETSEYATITEFEAVLNKETVFPGSKRLMETLAALPADKRAKKIDFYNQQVAAINGRSQAVGEVMDMGVNTVVDTIGWSTGYPFLGLAYSLFKTGGGRLARKLPSVNKIAAKIEEALYGEGDSANIHYLSKISRVAKVKRTF